MMIEKDLEIFQGLSNIIGSTPLLEIKCKYKGEERTVYAKAEHYNMTGSIKDRMALHILTKAYQEGKLEPNARIIEATSGNTGISLAAIGKALGYRVSICMPDWMSQERINLIKSFGAEIHLVSKEEGGFLGSIEMAEEIAKNHESAFLPHQFSNTDNCEAHYLTTGVEIYQQLRQKEKTPDALVAGVGTGGTIMGIGKYLREKNPAIKLHPLEPTNSPTMSTGYKVGNHRIQGISDEFIPPIIKLKELDKIIAVDDGDAIIMAQKLARELGFGVGISSGANFLGAIIAQNSLGKEAVVVTVFPDDNKKYLSTDLMKTESIQREFISSHIDLMGFKF